MKRFLFLAGLALLSSAVFAFPMGGHDRGSGYLGAEVKAIETEYGPRSLADLKVADLVPVAGRLDVARQKDTYVMVASGLSLAWPGAGQFASGDWAGGTLHTGLHLGITAASLAWAHSLLPADLRWGTLDYLGSSESNVEKAWASHRPRDFLPAVGALAAGGAVDLVLRFWSAQDARNTAKARIDDGTLTFEPRFDGGHWGLGMRF